MDDLQLLLQSPATLALLVSNIGLSVIAFGNVRLIDRLLFDVGRMRRNNEWYRMITSGFIHADPIHLFMNMLALFFLGPSLEYLVGTGAFFAIYILSLLAGSLWTLMEHFRSMNYRALGASGAVSGITTAIALFAPFATIYAFFALPMPLIVFAACYIVWSAWASHTQVRDGIGHAAHLGGALMGVVMVCMFWPLAVQSLWQQVMATLPTSF